MADPYSDLGNAEITIQTRIADAMEARCLDLGQIRMRAQYLGAINLPTGAFAVEFGSGTGHVTRDLMEIAGAETALGIEPSPIMVERARDRHSGKAGLTFAIGDASETGLEPETVDLVSMHTLLCHAPAARDLVEEAMRILKPGGILAVFDGDYDPTTVALSAHDPLQPIVDRMIQENVHDLWLSRRFAPFLTQAGFEVQSTASHGYVAEGASTYFLTVIDRGCDTLHADGVISGDTAAALKAEGRKRVDEGRFFGFMAYISVIAAKPG